jgi:hypothetical protein
MSEKPTVTLAELTRLAEQENKPQPLDYNEVADFAAAVLIVVRGLPRGEKLKVLRRAIKMVN